MADAARATAASHEGTESWAFHISAAAVALPPLGPLLWVPGYAMVFRLRRQRADAGLGPGPFRLLLGVLALSHLLAFWFFDHWLG